MKQIIHKCAGESPTSFEIYQALLSAKTKTMVHELKTWPHYFNQVRNGEKTFEVRKDDRGFRVNDEVLLKEFMLEDEENPEKYPDGRYTGRMIHRRISSILRGGQFGIEKGFVVLSLQTI